MTERIFIFKSPDGKIFKEVACLEEYARKNLKKAIESINIDEFILVGIEVLKEKIVIDNSDDNIDLDYD